MAYRMKGFPKIQGTKDSKTIEGSKSKHIESENLKPGDYMTYKTTMYDKKGNVRKDIMEEDTSQLKKDKTGRLYATNIFDDSDTVYAQKPIIPKIIK